VKLVSGSTVRYARTYNHSTMGFATGSASVQTHFILPQSTPAGTYQVSAVANGIASSPVNLTLATTQLAGSMVLYNQWATGYCENVTVKNTRSQAITSWKVLFNLGNATFNAMWNGVFSQSGSTLTVTNASNNGSLGAGASVTFGFCTQGPTPVSIPLMTSVTGS
jgi:cellulase/cellobiase CelA1